VKGFARTDARVPAAPFRPRLALRLGLRPGTRKKDDPDNAEKDDPDNAEKDDPENSEKDDPDP
jgi:hypothetical protein